MAASARPDRVVAGRAAASRDRVRQHGQPRPAGHPATGPAGTSTVRPARGAADRLGRDRHGPRPAPARLHGGQHPARLAVSADGRRRPPRRGGDPRRPGPQPGPPGHHPPRPPPPPLGTHPPPPRVPRPPPPPFPPPP